MRAVLQRVLQASVTVDNNCVGSIQQGYLILLGVGAQDTEKELEWLWNKINKLRIFRDAEGKTNCSLSDVQGEVLIVSQFTLWANLSRGNRPSFLGAGDPAHAQALYEKFVERAQKDVSHVATGIFGAEMQISLCNDGPFTLILDTEELMKKN